MPPVSIDNILAKLDWGASATLEGDKRRILRQEALNIRAAENRHGTGSAQHLAALVEGVRVYRMWSE